VAAEAATALLTLLPNNINIIIIMSHYRPSPPLVNPYLHANEVGATLVIRAEVESPRIKVEVRRVRLSASGEIVSLPVTDPIPNTWIIRSNDTIRMQPKSTIVYNTGLHLVIPDGVVGVISEHPYNHGEHIHVETLHLHNHLPFDGIILRIANHTVREVTIYAGDFLGLLHFYHTLRVEMKDSRPSPYNQYPAVRTPADSDDSEVERTVRRARRVYRERSPGRDLEPEGQFRGADHGRPAPTLTQSEGPPRPSRPSTSSSTDTAMSPARDTPMSPTEDPPTSRGSPVDIPLEEVEVEVVDVPRSPSPREVPLPMESSSSPTVEEPDDVQFYLFSRREHPTLGSYSMVTAIPTNNNGEINTTLRPHPTMEGYSIVTAATIEANRVVHAARQPAENAAMRVTNMVTMATTPAREFDENEALRNVSESNTERLHRALRRNGAPRSGTPVDR
jgi:hypothetical protein